MDQSFKLSKDAEDYLSRIDEVTNAVQKILKGEEDAPAPPSPAENEEKEPIPVPPEPKADLEPKPKKDSNIKYQSDYTRFEKLDPEAEEAAPRPPPAKPAPAPAKTLSEIEEITLRESQRVHDSGNRYFKEGNNEAAVKSYTSAFQLDDRRTTSILNRAQAHLNLKNWSAALEDAEFVLGREPENCKAFHRKACAVYEMGRYEEALGIWENKCMNLDKSSAKIFGGWIDKCKQGVKMRAVGPPDGKMEALGRAEAGVKHREFSGEAAENAVRDLCKEVVELNIQKHASRAPVESAMVLEQLYNQLTVQQIEERKKLAGLLCEKGFPDQICEVIGWSSASWRNTGKGKAEGPASSRLTPLGVAYADVWGESNVWLLMLTRSTQCLSRIVTCSPQAAEAAFAKKEGAKTGGVLLGTLTQLLPEAIKLSGTYDSIQDPEKKGPGSGPGLALYFAEASLSVLATAIRLSPCSKEEFNLAWPIILDLVGHWDNLVAGNAALILQHLCSTPQRASIVGNKGVECLLASIRQRRDDLHTGSATIVEHESRKAERNTQSNNHSAQKNCGIALGNLARQNEGCKERLRELQGFETLHIVSKLAV